MILGGAKYDTGGPPSRRLHWPPHDFTLSGKLLIYLPLGIHCMARLSDRQLAALLDEIAAAMRVDLPIVETMQRLQNRRLGAVATAAGQIMEAMKRGQTAADAIGCCDAALIDQAAAAVRASQRSGNPKILTRLSSLLRGRSEYLRASHLSWMYPLILLVIAYATAVGVMVPMLQKYQGRDFSWPESVLNFSRYLETNWFVPPIAMAIFAVAWLFWRSRHGSLPRERALPSVLPVADRSDFGGGA